MSEEKVTYEVDQLWGTVALLGAIVFFDVEENDPVLEIVRAFEKAVREKNLEELHKLLLFFLLAVARSPKEAKGE